MNIPIPNPVATPEWNKTLNRIHSIYNNINIIFEIVKAILEENGRDYKINFKGISTRLGLFYT